MTTVFQQSAKEIMQAILPFGGAFEVTYRRQSGETVSTIAVRDASVDEFGNFESTVSEWRQAWDLLVEDIGDSPCRGDTLIDSAGRNWTVQDILEADSDEEIVRVTVT